MQYDPEGNTIVWSKFHVNSLSSFIENINLVVALEKKTKAIGIISLGSTNLYKLSL